MKEKKDMDPSLVKLKKKVRDYKLEVFSQGGDGVFHCQVRLCASCVEEGYFKVSG